MAREEFPATDYERIARQYDDHRAQWAIPPDDVLASLIDERPRGVVVLDIGCGTGLYMANQRQHLAGSAARWIGLDPSASMLEQATKKEGLVSFVQGVAESLPFANDTIDYAHSSYSFHHFADKATALDEICRVLRPGGRLRVVNVEPWSMDGWWVYEFFPETSEIDRRRFWPVARLVDELERRGLTAEASVKTSGRALRLGDVLEEAESRTISQLDVLDDDAYDRGLEKLRTVVERDPDARIERESSILRLTATAPARRGTP
jgi:ubiquinone/menaquinone biosynthesis C-methylase UbiE